MSRILITALGLACMHRAEAAGAEDWLRSAALSPDGTRIVFRHRGDLWVVDARGGEAQPLAQGPAFEGNPVWSPDGSSVAFASDRSGNLDVYLVPARGGEPRRLTYHSSDDLPTAFSADGRSVIFSSVRFDTTVPLRYPHYAIPGTYRVSVQGGAAETFLPAPAEQARPAPDGVRWLYAERKGGELEWRKHERSPATWDLWLFDAVKGSHRRLTTGNWQHREPVWGPGGDTVFFLSERDGTSNVWRMTSSGEGAAVQVTRHIDQPVRSLSVSARGDICYTHDGRIHLIPAGAAAPREVAVTFARAATVEPTERDSRPDPQKITEFAVAPAGDPIAFIARGEIFLASAGGRSIRRLTHTSAAEAGLSFSPDGRSLAYASERDGHWQLYALRLGARSKGGEAERRLVESGAPAWRPRYSPDGTQIAFVEDGGLAVLDVASGSVRRLLGRMSGFTRIQGNGYDIRWNPDSRHLAFEYWDLFRPGSKVAYLSAAGGEVSIASLNAYRNTQPRWSGSGGWLAWMSDAQGMRDYTSSRVGQAVYALPLHPGAAAQVRLLAAVDRSESEKQKALGGSGASDAPLAPPAGAQARFDLARLSTEDAGERIVSFDLAADGKSLVWASQVAEGFALSGKRAGEPARRLAKVDGEALDQLQLDRRGAVLLLVDGAIQRVLPNGRASELVPRQTVTVDEAAERVAQVAHVGRYAEQAFFRPDLDLSRWRRMVERHAQWAPQAVTRREFRELLDELVGELDTSHTEAHDESSDSPPKDETAALGAVLQPAEQGYRIAYVAPGSPLRDGAPAIEAGAQLLAIDGHPLSTADDWSRWLNGKAGQLVELEYLDAGSGERRKRKVVPLSQEENQVRFYRGWVESRRQQVDRLSNGKLAYAHLEWMEDDNFRDLYNDALPRAGEASALVVDIRYNGGGWLHESLLPFLQGKFTFTLGLQGSMRSTHPEHAWPHPSVMLVNSANYSNASEVPSLYQSMGLGKLVGKPVAGTGLGGGSTSLGNGLSVRIANDACYDEAGRAFEGKVIEPDVLVEETPEHRAAGRDPQLEKAVEIALGLGGR